MHWDLLNASGLVRSQDIRRKHGNYALFVNLGQFHYGAYGTLIQPTKVSPAEHCRIIILMNGQWHVSWEQASYGCLRWMQGATADGACRVSDTGKVLAGASPETSTPVGVNNQEFRHCEALYVVGVSCCQYGVLCQTSRSVEWQPGFV